jgi:hypothetical protein
VKHFAKAQSQPLAVIVAIVALAVSGCATRQAVMPTLVLDQSTTQIVGWLSTKGEWVLFQKAQDVRTYSPYDRTEDGQCVSLVNGTDFARPEFDALDGAHVAVVGVAAAYDGLEAGASPRDRLLSKRYYGDEVVENSCLRTFVFVAHSIQRVQD